MTVHLCRDFLTLASASAPGTSMYLVSAFLRHVMMFDVDQHVNFDIESSSYTLGRYDLDATNPKYASINVAGAGNEFTVFVPSGAYSSSSGDVGRILALRSDLNSKHNSGLFRITAVTSSTVLGTGFAIDYRSDEHPPLESSSIAWRVYEGEDRVPAWSSGSNGSATGYCSRGSATSSRIMFNSPIGYNVRLCLESLTDRSGTVPCGFTIAPGGGSDALADFDGSAGHLHGPMWFDTQNSLYRGLAVGLSPCISGTDWTIGRWRFTAIGDTYTDTVVLFTQNVSFATGGNGWCIFGLPEDETTPLPDELIDRLFVAGFANALPNVTWRSGFFNDGHVQGVAWSRYGFPVPCVFGAYSDVRNFDLHVRNLATAIDTPWLGMTELVDVELIAGTQPTAVSPASTPVVKLAPRRLGRVPFVRLGRSNYSQWSLTPDKQWLHTLDGVFLPWGGPVLSGSLSGSTNAMVILSSSVLDGIGVQFFEGDPPMSDPYVDRTEHPTSHDVNRYRKTYSYRRQPVVEVGTVKAGSNPAKP